MINLVPVNRRIRIFFVKLIKIPNTSRLHKQNVHTPGTFLFVFILFLSIVNYYTSPIITLTTCLDLAHLYSNYCLAVLKLKSGAKYLISISVSHQIIIPLSIKYRKRGRINDVRNTQ